jgi:heptosyltransferase-3
LNRRRYASASIAALIGKLRPTTGDPQRLLLIRPDHLGDLLFVTPALRFLRLAAPNAHIALMVGPWSLPVVARNPNLDEILVCNFPWFDRKTVGNVAASQLLWTEASALRNGRFGVAAILRPDFAWGAMLAASAGQPPPGGVG